MNMRWIKRMLYVRDSETGQFIPDHEKRVLQIETDDGVWVDAPTVSEYWYRDEEKKLVKFIGSRKELKNLKSSFRNGMRKKDSGSGEVDEEPRAET